jgi:hypothetical protein
MALKTIFVMRWFLQVFAMNLVPPSAVDALPNAEWHGGVAEHALEARGVSQGVQAGTPKIKTPHAVLLWLAVWFIFWLPVVCSWTHTDDLGAYHLPLRSYYQTALEAGENWTWCPWIFGGYHLHGEGQIGGDHPLHQLLYRALPLDWAFSLECWWAYPATFFGMWWWLRQLRFSPIASTTTAFALSLSGYMTLRVVHTNAVQVIAHLPWLLGCLTWLEHRVRSSTSLRALLPPIACSAMLTGSQLLLGYPQYVVFTLIAECLWAATLFVRIKQRGGNNSDNKKAARIFVSAWITAKGLGILLGASQVLPTLEYLSLSERANWSSDAMFEGSWPLLNLTQLVAPYISATRVVGQNTHELTIFVGSTTVLLAVLGLIHRPRKSLLVVKTYATLLCGVGLVLALGDASPIAVVLQYVPVWNRFRFPCRATLLLCLGIVLLAALGVEAVLAQARRRRQGQTAQGETLFTSLERNALGITLLCSCFTTLYGFFMWREYLASSLMIAASPLIFLVAVLVILLLKSGKESFTLLTIALVAEMLFYNFTAPRPQLAQFINRQTMGANHVKRAWAQHDFGTVDPNWNIAPDLCSGRSHFKTFAFAQINGYAGVQPSRRLIYNDQHLGALRAAGVDAHWKHSQQTKNDQDLLSWGLGSLPRGTLLGTVTVAANVAAEIETVNLKQTALVDSEQNLSPPSPSDEMDVQVLTDRPGQLVMALETNRDALLVTTESFHPGWHARVDGAEVPTLRVNGDFLGVRVPQAAQRVECYFSDNWHAVGRWISLGSLGLLGLVMCLSRWRATAPGFVR